MRTTDNELTVDPGAMMWTCCLGVPVFDLRVLARRDIFMKLNPFSGDFPPVSMLDPPPVSTLLPVDGSSWVALTVPLVMTSISLHGSPWVQMSSNSSKWH